MFSKNNNPDNVSLSLGRGYMPLDVIYQKYLKQMGNTDEVVSLYASNKDTIHSLKA